MTPFEVNWSDAKSVESYTVPKGWTAVTGGIRQTATGGPKLGKLLERIGGYNSSYRRQTHDMDQRVPRAIQLVGAYVEELAAASQIDEAELTLLDWLVGTGRWNLTQSLARQMNGLRAKLQFKHTRTLHTSFLAPTRRDPDNREITRLDLDHPIGGFFTHATLQLDDVHRWSPTFIEQPITGVTVNGMKRASLRGTVNLLSRDVETPDIQGYLQHWSLMKISHWEFSNLLMGWTSFVEMLSGTKVYPTELVFSGKARPNLPDVREIPSVSDNLKFVRRVTVGGVTHDV